MLLRERTQPKENPTTFLVPVELENRDPELNATTKEVPTYGAMAVETLEDLMDAITSIVTIGMSGEIPAPRFVIFPSHAFGPVGWQHSPIGNRTGSHLGSCSVSMRARWRVSWHRNGASVQRPISGAASNSCSNMLEPLRAKTCCTARPTPGR